MALQFQPYANPFAKQQMEQEQYNQLNQTLGGLSNQFAQGAQANSQEKYRQAELSRQLELMDMERKKFGWQEAEQNRLNTVTPMEDPVDIFKSSYSLTQKNPNAKQQPNPFQNPQMGMQQPAMGMPQNRTSLFQGGQGQPQVASDLVAMHKQQFPELANLSSGQMGGGSQPPGMPPPGFSPRTYEESLKNRKLAADAQQAEAHANWWDKGGSTKTNMQSSTMDTATTQEQSLAKALAEGRVRPSDIGFRDRGRIVSLANEYAEKNGMEFQSYGGDVKAGMAKNLAFGKMGMNSLSLNTALGHVGDAVSSYEKVANTNQQWLNQPLNYLREKTNDPNIVALGLNLNALRGELATVFKNSSGTDQEISAWGNYLNEDLTPAQYIAAAKKIDELLTSRLNALKYQQDNVMNKSISERSLISPKSEGIRKKIQSYSGETSNIKQINSQAEYDALPSGTKYIDSNGKTARKK